MRKFRVTVEGKTYEVEVEELGGGRPQVTPPVPVLLPPAPAPAPRAPEPARPALARAATPDSPVPSGSEAVRAPLPGLVADVRVKPGETVAAGQVVVVLEAMKMENEIASPVAGTVTEVRAVKGSTVGLGDILVLVK